MNLFFSSVNSVKQHYRKSIFAMLVASLGICPGLFSQSSSGKLTGKITDKATNLSLSGVSIQVKNTRYGGTSITDGTYILSLPAGTYTVLYSYSGYATKNITDVVIQPGQSTFLDIILQTSSKELGGVVITSTAKKESLSAVYSAQKRSSAASDGISQEAIRRTPDNNMGQVLKRVTGVNVQDNKFVVVRGLADQYNQTMLNGAAMTSTETNRNAFAFDLIPASVVESVTINKTATPDMPGNFAGGIVQINTKEFPDNNFFSVTIAGSLADETYGKDFYSDKRGKYEWLGFGGKIRDLPKDFPRSTSRVPFTDLNLQEQFRYLKMLKNNLGPINHGRSGLNENVQFGFGRTFKFKNGTLLGVVAAVNHRKTQLIEQEAVARDPSLSLGSSVDDTLQGLGSYSRNIRYRYAVDLGGVLNIAYRFGNNKISFKNLYTQVLKNTYTDRPELTTDIDAFIPLAPYNMTVGVSYYTEQRRLLNHILGGEHRTGRNYETKLDWNVSATTINTKTPDTRNFILQADSLKNYGYEVSRNANLQYSLIGSSRVWYENKDFIYGGAFNITTPFMLFHDKQILKGGIFFQNRDRKSTGTVLPISGLKSNSVDSLLSPSNYFPGGGQVNVASIGLSGGSGNYNAASSLLAVYESLENRIRDKVRIIWGLRIENYQQSVNVYNPVFYDNFQQPELQSVKFAANTTFNFLPSVNIVYSPLNTINIRAAYSNTVIRPELKDLAPYERFDLQSFALSSGNSDLRSSSIKNYDLKLEWFPSSGEIISVAAFYKSMRDPIEYAFSDLSNNLSSKYAVNTGKAYVKGVEAEIRRKVDFIPFAPWLRHVTVFGNGAIIRSRVSGKKINSAVISSFSEHTLTGQPNYIINGGLSLLAMKETFELTTSYNRTGDFIYELGSSDLDVHLVNGILIPKRPHYREKARNMLDLVISKSFLRNKLKIKFNITNILKEDIIVYQDLNGNGKFDEPVTIKKDNSGRTANYLSGIDNTSSFITGQRSFSFSISYTF